ncbi:MAG: hypothetical protein V1720_13055 [bacterium]
MFFNKNNIIRINIYETDHKKNRFRDKNNFRKLYLKTDLAKSPQNLSPSQTESLAVPYERQSFNKGLINNPYFFDVRIDKCNSKFKYGFIAIKRNDYETGKCIINPCEFIFNDIADIGRN